MNLKTFKVKIEDRACLAIFMLTIKAESIEGVTEMLTASSPNSRILQISEEVME